MSPHSEVKPASLCIVGQLMVYKGKVHSILKIVIGYGHAAHPCKTWYILHLGTIIIENIQSELLKSFDPFHLTSND